MSCPGAAEFASLGVGAVGQVLGEHKVQPVPRLLCRVAQQRLRGRVLRVHTVVVLQARPGRPQVCLLADDAVQGLCIVQVASGNQNLQTSNKPHQQTNLNNVHKGLAVEVEGGVIFASVLFVADEADGPAKVSHNLLEVLVAKVDSVEGFVQAQAILDVVLHNGGHSGTCASSSLQGTSAG